MSMPVLSCRLNVYLLILGTVEPILVRRDSSCRPVIVVELSILSA